ncbi:MAG: hypothetical protein AAF126_21800 [Chloroflexota bacterium]
MPAVTSITFNGLPLDEIIQRPIFEDEATEIVVQFNVPFLNPLGDTQVVDASRENAYRLVFAGEDGVFDTVECRAIRGDDVAYDKVAFEYNEVLSRTAFSLDTSLLQTGLHRLLFCDEGYIHGLVYRLMVMKME